MSKFKPLRDSAVALLNRARTKHRMAITRREKEYCYGYQQGINDFIMEIVEIQKIYTWEYKIREKDDETRRNKITT